MCNPSCTLQMQVFKKQKFVNYPVAETAVWNYYLTYFINFATIWIEISNKNNPVDNENYKRILLKNIQNWLSRPEIIVIIGPRQTGKTFLVKNILPKITNLAIKYFNFEDFETVELFKNNPKEFISNISDKKSLYVFDEFQKIPEFTSALKVLYDQNKNIIPKIFLTGSSSLDMQEKVSQSLVGQCIIFNLFSLSFLEKYSFSQRDFLSEIISQTQKFPIEYLKKNIFFEQNKIKEKFNEYLLQGGYPELGELKKEQRWIKLKSIIQTILERDLQSLVKAEHLFSAKKLLEILAHRIGGLISFENLASEMQLNIKTVRHLVASAKRIPGRPRLGQRLREFAPREVRRILIGDYEIRYELTLRDVFVLRIFHTREDRWDRKKVSGTFFGMLAADGRRSNR